MTTLREPGTDSEVGRVLAALREHGPATSAALFARGKGFDSPEAISKAIYLLRQQGWAAIVGKEEHRNIYAAADPRQMPTASPRAAAASPAAPAAPASPIAPASQKAPPTVAVTPAAPGTFRCGVLSDGVLLIEAAGGTLSLSRDEARALVGHLDRVAALVTD